MCCLQARAQMTLITSSRLFRLKAPPVSSTIVILHDPFHRLNSTRTWLVNWSLCLRSGSSPLDMSHSISFVMFHSSLHQHMKKPFAGPLTFHLYICTLWMFTCQSTPRISPHTSVKTPTTPINHPQDARGRLPPTAQHRAPGFCLSDGPRIGCEAWV